MPFSDGADEIREQVDDEVSALRLRIDNAVRDGGEPPPELVRDFHTALTHSLRASLEPARWSLAWPDGWYIPGGADYRQHWILPPPGDHRIGLQWAQPPDGINHADASTGDVYAYASSGPGFGAASGWAGVAADVRPTATLSQADVAVDVDVQANCHLKSDLRGIVGSLVLAQVRCRVFACVWQIDPVTNAWTLKQPFGATDLLQQTLTGSAEYAPATAARRISGGPLSMRVQLEGGRRYAVGFQAQVNVRFDVQGENGQPYQRTPDDRWACWGSVTSSVAKITVDQKVLAP